MKQKCLNIYHTKGEIKVKEKHTYVMYIVKLNNTPSIPKKPDVLDMIAVAKE
jgi:ribosomal protein L30/L7E